MVELGREREGFREDELLSVSSYRCTYALHGSQEARKRKEWSPQALLEDQKGAIQSTCGFPTLHDN